MYPHCCPCMCQTDIQTFLKRRRHYHILFKANRSGEIYKYLDKSERYLELWTSDINTLPIFGVGPPRFILSGALKQELCVKVRSMFWQKYKVHCSMRETANVRRLPMRKAEEHQCAVVAFLCSIFLCWCWGSTAVLLGSNKGVFKQALWMAH